MGREIDTHKVAFLIQAFDVTPTFIILRHRRLGNLHPIAKGTEERVLHLSFLLLIGLSVTHQCIQELFALGVSGEVILPPYAKAVEATAQCQTLKALTVDGCEVDTLGKIVDILKGTILFTFFDDGCRC